MILFRMFYRIRFITGAAVILFLCSCSAPVHSPVQGSTPEPGIAAVLDSPLVTFAEQLGKGKSTKNHVELLDIGQDALLARIHLIRSARRSITIQTMIWANDETGRYLVYELIQAARRGVKVKLLIDHLASEQDVEIASFLANVHPNFQVKLFNPVNGLLGQKKAEPSFLDTLYAAFFTFKRLNQRMHNKTFVVDGLVGITGGRNYQNAYYDQARGMNYKDRDVLIAGPVVRSMQKSFDSYWIYKRSISIGSLYDVEKFPDRNIGKRWVTRDSYKLNGFFAKIDAQANDSHLISKRFVAPLISVEQANFIADTPNKRGRSLLHWENGSKITLALAEMVSRAEGSVYIQTPYLVLSSRAVKLFRELREEHPEIDVRISTNSLAATDSWYVYALSYKQKKTYLSDLRFRIFEFKPLPGDLPTFMPNYTELKARASSYAEEQKQPAAVNLSCAKGPLESLQEGRNDANHKLPYFCVHAKSLVVDDLDSFVGSYNLDPRSENLNTECGLVIRDAYFAHLLKQTIATDMKPRNSWVIAPKKRFLGVDETNAILVELSNLIPLVDLWPFRYTASFELIPGKQPVDIDDPDFYENYSDAGSFPQVRSYAPAKALGAFSTKSFFSFVKPLL